MDPALEGLPQFFEPICRLGEGGMGVVWSVCDRRVNKIGALKVIRQKGEMTPVTLTRFEREIRNFAQLVHPYIVQVYDVGQMETGEPYIFMEQIDGKPISAKRLRNRSFDEIMMLIDRILDGLGEAHAHGLIHRDLKPDNILVTEDSEGRLMPKLMDFGLALRVDENDMRITSDGMVVGTPIYMAPEQACDEHYQICPATDFYSIGCILYELFCGDPPFKGSNAVMIMVAQAKDKPKPFTPLVEFAEARRLAPIIDRLLEKEPDQRYETAADLRAALRKQFLIRDGQQFGLQALRNENDTIFDVRKDEEMPFFSSDLARKSYHTILPDLEHCNYNYSVISLRPPMFVGRSSAKHVLNRYLKDVYQCRRTALTLITGKPGVGKTRFLESFAQDCYRQGIASSLVIDGAVCKEFKFAVYRALFAKLLLKTLTPQQVVLSLCRFLQTTNENERHLLILKEIFNAEQEDREPDMALLDEVFLPVFAILTKNRPLLLILDNLSQEQLRETWALAEELTDHPKMRLPILICMVNTTINDIPTDTELAFGNNSALWLRRGVSLDPLSNSDMHTLVTQSLGISESLAGFIENMSSGLPQIAVDLARQWQLAGFLEPTESGYISKQPLDKLPVPRVVHEAILRQINLTFGEYPQRSWAPVAAISALFGEKFTPKMLAGALSHIPTSQKLISHSIFISLALAGGVLKTLDETTLAFCNPLIREALLAVLQPYETQDYHYAIAQARMDAAPSFENSQKIAYHLTQAQRYYEAYMVCRKLSRQCILHGDLKLASDYIEQAKESLKQHLGFIDARTPEVIELWFTEAEIAIDSDDLGKARQYLQWLEYSGDFSDVPEKQAQWMALNARVLAMSGQMDASKQWLDMALEQLMRLTEPLTHEQLEIKFSVLSVLIQYHTGVNTAFIETARQLNDALYVSRAFLVIAGRCLASGDVVRAMRILNMAIDTAHRNGDLRTEAQALYLLSKTQSDAQEVRLKTLYEALKCFEKLADYKDLANVHKDIARVLADTSPDEARIHEHWSQLIA